LRMVAWVDSENRTPVTGVRVNKNPYLEFQ
jgi:hypothetical protein